MWWLLCVGDYSSFVAFCDLIKKVKSGGKKKICCWCVRKKSGGGEDKDKGTDMGAKASTNGNQSPRTFSNSSSSDVVSAGNNNATSFNFLRAIHGVEVANDSRQRARSMSSVPDIQSAATNHHHHPTAYSNHPNHNPQPYSHDVNGFQNSGAGGGPHFDLSSASTEDGSNHDDNPMLQGINALGLGRVYTAASLPSHIWSINGEFTQVLPAYQAGTLKYFWILIGIWVASSSTD